MAFLRQRRETKADHRLTPTSGGQTRITHSPTHADQKPDRPSLNLEYPQGLTTVTFPVELAGNVIHTLWISLWKT